MNIDALDLKELKELQTQVARAIASYESRKRKEAVAALEESARQHGFNLADLVESLGTVRKRKPANAKYANPANPSETWTGRGRKPRWIEAALASGKSIDDLLI
jgi:DNA-binding protein H-NS